MAALSRHRRPRTRPSTDQLPLPLEIPAPPQLIPLPEARRWLGVSLETWTRLLLSGQLPVVHLGRKVCIEDTVLLAWLGAHERVRGA
jgi:excisionase family DNA binding protein